MNNKRRRILFVDDEPELGRQFARVVKGMGIDVDVATSARSALRMLQNFSYPVIVTDVQMPGATGLELIADVHVLHPNTVFILVSGLVPLRLDFPPTVASSVVSVITKPWERHRMSDALDRAFDLYEDRVRPTPTSSYGILLIEDDSSDARWVRRSLRNFDHKLTRVTRLDRALEVLQREAIDVIISDLSLPDACGLDSVVRLRSAAPNSALIVLTGNDEQRIAVQGSRLGAHEFLCKGTVDDFALRRSVVQAFERCRVERALVTQANTDALTGIANRAQFLERLSHGLKRCERGAQLGVLFIDLNNFKPINDTYGHHVGDLVLCEFALRLRDSVRGHDTTARFGGDEFVVLLEDLEDEGPAIGVCERILRALETPFVFDGVEVEVGASIGVALSAASGASGVDLLSRADKAMYRAKKAGDSRWELSPCPPGTPHRPGATQSSQSST